MRTFGTKLLSVFLLIAIIATPVGISISRGVAVQRASAQGMDMGELGKGFVVGAAACVGVAYAMKYISSAIALLPAGPVPETSAETPVKKALDCILYQVVNTIIEDMIKSITRWAQSGFEGNPVFVTQIDQHMLNQLDNIAGMYIEAKAPFLCSPFRAEIQLALARSYERYSGRMLNSCTLTGAVSNVNDFLAGDFYAGGFDGWLEMTTNPYNNPYGAFLETQMGLQLKLVNEQGRQSQDLLQGRGFLSKQVQDCYEKTEDCGGSPCVVKWCDEPRTVTPGSFIQEQVGKQLGLSVDRLSFADEINEMITAVVAYLIRDVLLGEGGLAGYDPADYANNQYPELPGITTFPLPPTGAGGAGCQATPTDTDATVPGDTITYREDGTFLVTTDTLKHRDFDFGGEAQNVQYSRVTVNLDVKAGEFTSVPGSYNYHEIFYLTRGADWWNQVIGHVGLKINGSDGNKLVSEQHFAGVCNSKQSQYTPSTGETFHIEYIYDTETREAGVNLTSVSGNNAYTWTTNTVNFIDSDSNGFRISVGGIQDDAGEYQVALGNGWEFSNLEVEISYGGSGSGSGSSGGSGASGGTNPTGGTDPSSGGTPGSPGGGKDPLVNPWTDPDDDPPTDPLNP